MSSTPCVKKVSVATLMRRRLADLLALCPISSPHSLAIASEMLLCCVSRPGGVVCAPNQKKGLGDLFHAGSFSTSTSMGARSISSCN